MTDPAAGTSPHPADSSSSDYEAPAIYTLWAVFRRDPANPATLDPAATAAELHTALAAAEKSGVTVRGIYDVSGFKAESDLMFWLHGADPAALQAALRQLRRTKAIAGLLPEWNYMAVHRAAEFNKHHIPAFVEGKAPKEWTCVYPFIRSHEWYLLRDGERARMLKEHGMVGHSYTGVLSNTVAAFALGDYEWVVPLESDELVQLTDMMRALRYVDARLHVTLETPFFTGRRITPDEVAEVLS
ncbi:MAG TPA: hydrogen peroxide-dependent heme synthase [Microbacteriaceae bacterium]|nr:hydrogen peroxide-dependent heme synthase [Microbacteriaceae bacterium]